MQSDDFSYYPPKPEINEKNSASILKTILSLFLFVGLFLFMDISINLIFVVVLVLFIHEMGHFIAMKHYGYEDVGMFFIPFLGAVVTGRKDEMSQLQRAIILLAGPLPGILLGIGLILGVQYNWINEYFLIHGFVFIVLNVLNLIPIDPLDGGKLFELLFFSLSDIAKIIFHGVSAALMIGIGIYSNSIIIMILGAMMITRITSGLKLMKIRKRIGLLEIPLNTTYLNLSDRDYWRIRREYIHIVKLDNLIAPESKEYDEKEEVLAPAIRNLLNIPIIHDLGIGLKLLFLGIWITSIIASIYVLVPSLEKIQMYFTM